MDRYRMERAEDCCMAVEEWNRWIGKEGFIKLTEYMPDAIDLTIPEIALEHTDREKVLSELYYIERQRGMLTAPDVVESAKNESSPLHNLFDWSDRSAARKYREQQARVLINSVKVEIMGRKSEAFFNVRVMVNDVPTRGYMNAERVMSDEELSQQVISSAVREARYWQQKYENIQQLKGIVDSGKLSQLEEGLRAS